MYHLPPGKQRVSTIGEKVVTNPQINLSFSVCTHEEADTRIFVHVADQMARGLPRILVRSTDSDIHIIAISVVHKIPGIQVLLIAFGKSPSY